VTFPALLPAVFRSRPNRFLVLAEVDGIQVRAASRDPGRLRELLRPGAAVLLAPAGGERKTAFTLTLVRHRGLWVSLVPGLANGILESALARGDVPGLRGMRVVRREVPCGRSRFDFLLEGRGRKVLTEVKSATLVERGRALFPDAPTTRGARHLKELTRVRKAGHEALVVFVVQRPDARVLSPNERTDPVFARALEAAFEAGVRILCYRCSVTPRGCTLLGRIPLELPGNLRRAEEA
jgi:sugar fermentation stimulation protein A